MTTEPAVESSIYVLVDVSRTFFATAPLGPTQEIDYTAALLVVKAVTKKEPRVLLFSSVSPSNEEQGKYMERLRRETQGLSFVATPDEAVVTHGARNDTIRFDTVIAYVLCMLTMQGKAVAVMTDSYGLMEPLKDVKRRGCEGWLMFFSHLLDQRYVNHVLNRTLPIDLLDLSPHAYKVLRDKPGVVRPRTPSSERLFSLAGLSALSN